MKAIIIGGGIGGISAGIALRYIGWDVTVFEQADEIGEVGAGITIWSNAINALNKFDAGDTVLAAESIALERGEVRTWRDKLIAAIPTGEFQRRTGAATVAIHRASLIEALHKCLGSYLRTNSRCVSIHQTNDKATAVFAGGNEESADILIGADGIRSVVREQLHGQSEPRYAGYIAWRGIATFRHPEHPDGHWCLWIGRGSEFGYVPIGNGRVYWFATKNCDKRGSITTNEDAKQEAQQHLAGWPKLVMDVVDASEPVSVLRNDILDRAPIRQWGRDRITLLGDAAHASTPHLGQGACQAIEDGVILAHCLSDHGDVKTALTEYEKRRIPRTAKVVRASWKVGRMLQLENPILCWLRNIAMKLASGASMDRTLVYAGYECPDLLKATPS